MMDKDRDKDFRVRVWFQHNLEGRSSQYIVQDLPGILHDTLKESVHEQLTEGLVGDCPEDHAMLIDFNIADMVADSWKLPIHDIFTKLDNNVVPTPLFNGMMDY
jgi:hypothetical protein